MLDSVYLYRLQYSTQHSSECANQGDETVKWFCKHCAETWEWTAYSQAIFLAEHAATHNITTPTTADYGLLNN